MKREAMPTADHLHAVLNHPLFVANLSEVLQFTANNYREAGFAVYTPRAQGLGEFTLSNVVSSGADGFISRETSSIDLASQLQQSDKKIRSDIGLVLHSHSRVQGDTSRHPAEAIYPSRPDLVQTDHVEIKNTGHVTAIASPEDSGKSGYIYLLRKKNPNLPNYYHSDDREITSALQDSGFGQAFLYFDGQEFLPDEEKTLQAEVAKLF